MTCDHGGDGSPLLSLNAYLEDDGHVRIVLTQCPHLSDAELGAIAGAMSRALAAVAADAIAAVAQQN